MSGLKTLNLFYTEVKEAIEMASADNPGDWTNEDFLTTVMLDYLDEAGEVSDYVICPFRDRGLQLNAYSFSDDYENLNLFVTIYVDGDTPSTISQKDVEAAIRRELQLFRHATNDLFKSFEKDNDTYEFAINVYNHRDKLKTVHVCALTNGLIKPLPFKNITLAGAEISFTLWDLERLYRCVTSGKMREPIEIDFEKEFGETIPCLVNNSSPKYTAYLAIFSGTILAGLYDKYRDRLLEKNVRSFLQVRGSVNKGIRNTLRQEPDMFLAFNNGISVTAEDIKVVNNPDHGISIKYIKDMQIVNGGQTTASIFTASQDKKNPVDLSKVFIQAKISVISSESDIDEIVPMISACANTQNKIQVADFSANDPFHLKIEELSRSIWAPVQNGGKPVNWFYERARGQYADMLVREGTTKKRAEYKLTHPSFTKTDLAKYENSWEQRPFEVSEGAQKNFKKFTVRLQEAKSFVPDADYYKHLISKVILFRRTEKLVSEHSFGGYRSNIVTYTVAFLSFKTQQRLDLENIWKTQSLTPVLEDEIRKISVLVHDFIINAPNGANVGEWCKKEQCWESLKNVDYKISDELEKELTGKGSNASLVSSDDNTSEIKNELDSITEDAELIDKASQIPSTVYYAISKWSKENNILAGWQRSLMFSMGTIISRNKKPTIKQAKWALKIYAEALKNGFTEEQ